MTKKSIENFMNTFTDMLDEAGIDYNYDGSNLRVNGFTEILHNDWNFTYLDDGSLKCWMPETIADASDKELDEVFERLTDKIVESQDSGTWCWDWIDIERKNVKARFFRMINTFIRLLLAKKLGKLSKHKSKKSKNKVIDLGNGCKQKRNVLFLNGEAVDDLNNAVEEINNYDLYVDTICEATNLNEYRNDVKNLIEAANKILEMLNKSKDAKFVVDSDCSRPYNFRF